MSRRPPLGEGQQGAGGKTEDMRYPSNSTGLRQQSSMPQTQSLYTRLGSVFALNMDQACYQNSSIFDSLQGVAGFRKEVARGHGSYAG